MFDAGYLPETLLNITTRYRGHNANTATPVIVDSNNNPINVNNWRKHLRGDYHTRYRGDHITPTFNNMPIKLVEASRGGIEFAGHVDQTRLGMRHPLAHRHHLADCTDHPDPVGQGRF